MSKFATTNLSGSIYVACIAIFFLSTSFFPPPPFQNLSFLGDSITSGYLLSNVNDRYSTQTATALSVNEINGGISASTLTVAGGNNPGVNRYTSYIRNNGKYVVYIGINDVTRCTNQQFQDALTTVVQGLLNSYAADDIILCNLAWTSYDNQYPNFYAQHMAFNTIIRNTADLHRTKFCDFYSITLNQPSLFIGNPPDPDAYLHPNTAGATALKNRLVAVINAAPTAFWIGPSGGSWNASGNWSTSAVPGTNTEVVINSGSVMIASNASCKSLRLHTGATVTTQTGVKLSVTQ